MRWILVFVILYLIPLTVIFKNYKRRSRALIYGSIYVVLATTLVISNMYISSISKLEKDIISSTSTDYDRLCVSLAGVDDKQEDLLKLKLFKRDISDIEAVALDAFKECMANTKDMKLSIDKLKSVEKDIDKALYMCEQVVEGYEQIVTPVLSEDEYNETLDECVEYMKKAYELRYKVVLEVDKMLKEKDVSRISFIRKYMSEADENINKYKNKIIVLEKQIEGK